MKERVIICIILLLTAFVVCGREDKPVELYSPPAEEIAEINRMLSEPNEASYKAWLGWE